jgi:hypothetical protein
MAVNNYNMTNTSWYLNEFQFYGSIGFGRPALNDTTSTSFLTALKNNGIIDSFTWSYSATSSPFENLMAGSFMVGGVDSNQMNQVYYTDSPINPAAPDAWQVKL